MFSRFIFILLAAASSVYSFGLNSTDSSSYGVDVSQPITSTVASCLASAGIKFIIPRGYKSTGSVDTNVCTTLKYAYSAGIATRDVYMFPCPTCSASASSQLSTLVSYLKSSCSSYWSGRVWLDIEGTSYWSLGTSGNKAWYQALVDACSAQGVTCGVYSNANNWQQIFGSTTYTYGNSLKLWYAHYDSNPTSSDWSSYKFGSWSSPYMKQYIGDTTQCSFSVDKNVLV